MPKIETPRDFAAVLPAHVEKNSLPYLTEIISARDAAIRAEYDALLKTCGEALGDISKLRGDFAEAEDPSAKGFFHMACDRADTALAALKDAGVRV